MERVRPGGDPPQPLLAPRGANPGAGQHRGAAIGRIAGIEHHQPGVVDPAIGIFEPGREPALQRGSGGMAAQIDRAGCRQPLAPADMVIEKQPEPQQPARPQSFDIGQDKAQRLDDVRRDPPQRLALGQRFADQRELVMLKVAQPAVDQLGRGGTGALGQIARLEQQHPRPAPGGIAGDSGSVDPAADHRQVIGLGHALCLPGGCSRRNSRPRSL